MKKFKAFSLRSAAVVLNLFLFWGEQQAVVAFVAAACIFFTLLPACGNLGRRVLFLNWPESARLVKIRQIFASDGRKRLLPHGSGRSFYLFPPVFPCQSHVGTASAILLSFWGEQQAIVAFVTVACTISGPGDYRIAFSNNSTTSPSGPLKKEIFTGMGPALEAIVSSFGSMVISAPAARTASVMAAQSSVRSAK